MNRRVIHIQDRAHDLLSRRARKLGLSLGDLLADIIKDGVMRNDPVDHLAPAVVDRCTRCGDHVKKADQYKSTDKRVMCRVCWVRCSRRRISHRKKT